MSRDENKTLTHVYRNTKTGRERPFYFSQTCVKGLWNCVTEDGKIIGEWDRRSRMYRMCDGLSLHVIQKIITKESESLI